MARSLLELRRDQLPRRTERSDADGVIRSVPNSFMQRDVRNVSRVAARRLRAATGLIRCMSHLQRFTGCASLEISGLRTADESCPRRRRPSRAVHSSSGLKNADLNFDVHLVRGVVSRSIVCRSRSIGRASVVHPGWTSAFGTRCGGKYGSQGPVMTGTTPRLVSLKCSEVPD